MKTHIDKVFVISQPVHGISYETATCCYFMNFSCDNPKDATEFAKEMVALLNKYSPDSTVFVAKPTINPNSECQSYHSEKIKEENKIIQIKESKLQKLKSFIENSVAFGKLLVADTLLGIIDE